MSELPNDPPKPNGREVDKKRVYAALIDFGIQAVVDKMSSGPNGIEIKANTYNEKTYEDCFIALEAVDWLVSEMEWDREESVYFCQMLVDRGMMEHVSRIPFFRDGFYFYRFISSTTELNESDLQLKFIQFRQGVDIRDRVYHFKTYKCSFIGSEAILWLCKEFGWTRKQATAFGETLRKRNLIEHVNKTHPFKDAFFFYRFPGYNPPAIPAKNAPQSVSSAGSGAGETASGSKSGAGSRQSKQTKNARPKTATSKQSSPSITQAKVPLRAHAKARQQYQNQRKQSSMPPYKLEPIQKLLREHIEKLNAISAAFYTVRSTSSFVRVSQFSKLVVMLGKQLDSIEADKDFEPPVLTQEEEDMITDPKLQRIIKRIIPTIAFLVSKLESVLSKLTAQTDVAVFNEATAVVERVEEIFASINVVTASTGFNVEGGTTDVSRETWKDYLPHNSQWYQEYFLGQEHKNFITPPDSNEVVIASIKVENDNGVYSYRAIIRSKDGIKKGCLEISREQYENWPDKCVEGLKTIFPAFENKEFKVCEKKHGLQQGFLAYEQRDMRVTHKFKFGVMLCKVGQSKEEEMFCNSAGSADYEKFLTLLGSRVVMQGYTGFLGGLDAKSNTTGTHAITTKFQNNEIMYHVATMLPTQDNNQQWAKKRHIGNDIILVVFQEEGSDPFDPTTVKSNYIQIIIVVRVLKEANATANSKVYYTVSVASQADVPRFGPPVPYPPVFSHDDELRNWLLEKMVNAELAAYHSKLFRQQFRSTYKTLLNELVQAISEPSLDTSKSKKKKGKNKGTTTDP